MTFSIDTIRARRSVRTYDGARLSREEEAALLSSFAEALPTPFGTRPRFALVGAEPDGKPLRMGTYGLISGAAAYVVGAAALGEGGMEDFGYAMEGIVLRATELGLGSCWLGGIFDRGRSARVLGLASGEVVAAALSLGRPAAKPSLQERLVYGASGARGRKPHAELFFAATKDGVRALTPWAAIPADSPWLAQPRAELLEAIRIGPSASNKQPWRLLLEDARGSSGPALHLYLHEDRAYNNALGDVKIQRMDMGIAMRHAEVAAAALGLPGSWTKLDPPPFEAPAPRSYVASFLAG